MRHVTATAIIPAVAPIGASGNARSHGEAKPAIAVVPTILVIIISIGVTGITHGGRIPVRVASHRTAGLIVTGKSRGAYQDGNGIVVSFSI